MRIMNAAVFVMIVMFVAGCSGKKIREGMYKGIYDGSRIENMRGATPAENAGKPDMSYDQYEQQRKQQFK